MTIDRSRIGRASKSRSKMREKWTLDYDTLMQRMFCKFEVNPETLCWEWTAGKYKAGYGSIGVGKRNADLAHRVMYECLVGPIPGGLTIDHLCAVRACVNPDHMEPVPIEENVRRAAPRMRTEICPKGHIRTPEGTYVDPHGKRSCGICKKAADARNGKTERSRQKAAEYRANHKEEARAYHIEWAAANAAARREYHAEWASANREHLRAYRAEWRARRKEQARKELEASGETL